MSKKFDCVEMKHEGARELQKLISKFSIEEELEFWRQQTEELKRRRETVKLSDTKSQEKA